MTEVDKDTTHLLEEEGEVAADYLEEFLDIADLDGDIDIDIRNGRASLEVLAAPGTLTQLQGVDGEVLDALQNLTRLAVQAKTGERSRLMLDIAGFRAGQRESILTATTAAIEQVKLTQQPVEMEPANAFERKVVHDAVAQAGLHSDSHGVEPNRYVVIHVGQ